MFRAFIQHANKDQFSPFSTACIGGHIKIVEMLLADAEIAFGGEHTKAFNNFLEQQNAKGFTPLNAACNAQKRDAAKLLIEYSADPNIKNNVGKGFSALDNVRKYNKQDWQFVYDAAEKTPIPRTKENMISSLQNMTSIRKALQKNKRLKNAITVKAKWILDIKVNTAFAIMVFLRKL